MRYVRYALAGLVAVVAVLTVVALFTAEDDPGVELYARAPVPAVPDATAFFGASGELADGEYWVAGITGDGEGGFLLTLQQAFFGPRCADELGAAACDGDVGVRTEPTRTLGAAPATLSSITVVGENRQNFAVFADELATLVAGGEPAAAAPDGYAYVPYPFLATVRDGVVVQLRQVWVAEV